MPVTRAIERNSTSLPSSPQKTYTLTTQLSTQYEETDGDTSSADRRISQRRSSDLPKRSNVSSRYLTSSSALSVSQSQTSRRSGVNDGSAIRGRSNTDVQTVTSVSNGLKHQQQSVNGTGSDKSLGHHNQQQQQQPQEPPPKAKCMLPTTTSQPGYVTSSKLFNMMGYGLQNQYLFMLAHYLYIIDCRPREKFDENHIITGKNAIFHPTQ
jgi:hypothetical protein